MSVIGIDLGTLRATAAYIGALGAPQLIADRQDISEFHTSCSVFIDDRGVLVGKPAEELATADPRSRIVQSFKNRLGGDASVLTDNDGREWGAQGIAGIVMRKLARDLHAATHEDAIATMLAVPPHFTEDERGGLREAANIAGLKNVQLVEEPVAVAIYHGFADSGLNQTLMVIDIGAAGVSATLLKTPAEGLEKISSAYREGGGNYIEQAIVGLIIDECLHVHGIAPSNSELTTRELANAAAAIRQQLWVNGKTSCRKTILVSGKTLEIYLTARHVQTLAARLKADIVLATRECLLAASMEWAGVHRVLLAGGGALFCWVPEYIATLSGCQVGDILLKQARVAAAFGAAILANQKRVAASAGESTYDAVVTSDIGLTVFDRQHQRYILQPLIKCNTPLPASAKTTCYTQRADQKRLLIQIGQSSGGENDSPVDIGMFEFSHIENPRKNYPIEITLSHDMEGIIVVSAFDPETGKRVEQVMGAGKQERAAWLHRQKSWLTAMRINE